jgi:hypothetical protein
MDLKALLKQANTDYDTLVLWRRAITPPKHLHHDTDNISIKEHHGNALAYTLDRLERERPELYARTLLPKEDKARLSANAAAIKAGFRKKPTPLQRALRAWAACMGEAWAQSDWRKRPG